MANRQTAIKSIRKNKKRCLRNLAVKTRLKKEEKKLKNLFAEKKLDQLNPAVRKLQHLLDKTANNGVIHKNKANRKKAYWSARFSSLKSALEKEIPQAAPH